jgi:hypothetical protein
VLSFTRSSSSIKLQQLKIEYGINPIEVVRLVDINGGAKARAGNFWYFMGLV